MLKSARQNTMLEELKAELDALRSRFCAHEGLAQTLSSAHARLEDHCAFFVALRKRCPADEPDCSPESTEPSLVWSDRLAAALCTRGEFRQHQSEMRAAVP